MGAKWGGLYNRLGRFWQAARNEEALETQSSGPSQSNDHQDDQRRDQGENKHPDQPDKPPFQWDAFWRWRFLCDKRLGSPPIQPPEQRQCLFVMRTQMEDMRQCADSLLTTLGGAGYSPPILRIFHSIKISLLQNSPGFVFAPAANALLRPRDLPADFRGSQIATPIRLRPGFEQKRLFVSRQRRLREIVHNVLTRLTYQCDS